MMIIKQRHPCLTAWLIFVIIGDSLASLFYLFLTINFNYYSSKIAQSFPFNVTSDTLTLYMTLSVFNVICEIALYKWKKWGFYGLLLIDIVLFIVSSSKSQKLEDSFFVFIGIGILYVFLNIDGENKAWSKLD